MNKRPDIFVLHWVPQILWQVLLHTPNPSLKGWFVYPAPQPYPSPRQVRANKSPAMFSPFRACRAGKGCGKVQGSSKSLFVLGQEADSPAASSNPGKINANIKMTLPNPPQTPRCLNLWLQLVFLSALLRTQGLQCRRNQLNVPMRKMRKMRKTRVPQ